MWHDDLFAITSEAELVTPSLGTILAGVANPIIGVNGPECEFIVSDGLPGQSA
ncbi:MAG: hypothetical protein QOJ80_4095 [Mycobacterium sp.]|nr:hypothetical protein [Mycobacterium sp.]